VLYCAVVLCCVVLCCVNVNELCCWLLADNGGLFYGDHNAIQFWEWNFHQFEVLDIIFDLLDKKPELLKDKSDPIAVSRYLS